MNQLVQINTNADAYRASTDAAGLCREIVLKTAKPIQGKRYVGVEGWQAIAIAHGCAASADHVERVNDEGMSGFKAVGIVRRMSDGAEIARGEGFLGDDEKTWSSRPVYARRAMVQTRAISRACRSAFAHVVVMIDAGLQTTPAEEVPDNGFDNGNVIDAVANDSPEPRTKLDGPYTSKTALRNAVNAVIAAVRAAQTFDALKGAIREGKPAIEQAKKDWPSLISGDPNLEEDIGLDGAYVKRKAELDPESAVNIVIDKMKRACTSVPQLKAWLEENGDEYGGFDGEDSRRFQTACDEYEAGLGLVETANA